MSNLPDYTDISHCLLDQVRLCSRIISGYLEYEHSGIRAEDVLVWENLLKNYRPLNADNLFVAEDYWKTQELKGTKLKLKFPQYLYLLEHQRMNRIKLNNLRFEQEQLWYILFNLLEISHSMQQGSYNLGDVSCGTIILNEFGRLKVFNQLSVPCHRNYIEKRTLRKAPELYRAGNDPTLLSGVKSSKAESFSIAATMVEISMLCSLESMYCGDFVKIEEARNVLDELKLLYSTFFVKILSDMLTVDPEQRPSTSEVYAMLRPYETEILEVKPFRPDRERSEASLVNYLETNHT